MKPIAVIYNWRDHDAAGFGEKGHLLLTVIHCVNIPPHHLSGKHSMLHAFSARLSLFLVRDAALDSESVRSLLSSEAKKLLDLLTMLSLIKIELRNYNMNQLLFEFFEFCNKKPYPISSLIFQSASLFSFYKFIL